MKSRYLALIGILYLLSALGFIWHLHNRTTAILMDHIDRQLITAALATDAILGSDYHIHIVDESSKSEEEDWNAIMRLTDYANQCGMTYLYTAVRRNGMIYLTTSSASRKELDTNTYVRFFDPYPDASDKMHQAFLQDDPVFSTYNDRWGRFRAVYIKRISPDKTPYVTCAELSLERYYDILRSRALEHSSMAIVIFSLFVVFSVMFFGYMRRKEVTLMEAQEAAESGIRTKDEFLAVMSHEIRTPLNGILGANSLLKQTRLTPEQAELSEVVNTSGTKLLRIIDDILEFSRIESGNAAICEETFDILDLLDKAMDMAAFQLAGKGLSIGYVIAPDVPRYLIQDEDRLHQVLANLIGNAIKYTEKGHVLVNVAYNKKEGRASLHFDITDTGIGISEKDQVRIFDIFSQVDSTISRKYGGTGLGLTICQRLVKAMGGDISVVSTPGRGSTFRFYVACDEDLKRTDWISSTRKKACRALICVKDPFVKRCLESQLQYLSISFNETRPDAQHISNGNDIWLIDQDTASAPFTSSLLHSIAFRVVVIQNGKSNPVNDFTHLSVPISARKLISLFYCLNEADPAFNHKGHEDTFGTNRDNPPLSILYADDDVLNRKIVVRMLKKIGYAADEAENGKEVLTACENKHYDLIFMDMQMPEMDGIEATRALKTKYGENTPVIIALTANALPEHREACRNAGMDDYLTKPLNLDALENTLHNYIPRMSNGRRNDVSLHECHNRNRRSRSLPQAQYSDHQRDSRRG